MDPKKPIIDYSNLRKISPETARTAVLEYLSSVSGNISQTARAFGIQRITVYGIIKKSNSSNLKDQSKAPKKVANKTAPQLEMQILYLREKFGFGAKKIAKYLGEGGQTFIPVSTIKGILKRAGTKI